MGRAIAARARYFVHVPVEGACASRLIILELTFLGESDVLEIAAFTGTPFLWTLPTPSSGATVTAGQSCASHRNAGGSDRPRYRVLDQPGRWPVERCCELGC